MFDQLNKSSVGGVKISSNENIHPIDEIRLRDNAPPTFSHSAKLDSPWLLSYILLFIHLLPWLELEFSLFFIFFL